MTADFTHRAYRGLLDALREAGFRTATFREGKRLTSCDRHVIMRHDVDRLPRRALAMARLEDSVGVRSTYFFRAKPQSFDAAIVKAIADLGHEIGYHYETLADTRGDLDAAWALFAAELRRLSRFAPITSIAMHGRPLSKWDSLDLWHRFDYRALGIDVEAYRDIDWSAYRYFTDTGRSWNAEENVRDRVDALLPSLEQPPQSTADLCRWIKTARTNFVISAHPERWAGSLPGWLQATATDAAANVVKTVWHFGSRRRA